MYHGILFSSTKAQTSDTGNDLDESPGNCAKWKKTIPKVIYCNDSIYATFLTWQIFRNAGKIRGCWRIGMGVGDLAGS